MAERSFKAEVEHLRLGAGHTFRGEGILAVTKALLQSGVAYVGGYQGSPISHLMDVFADANDLLSELGVHFETSASEATAAAMLAASVNYPLRGAVAWKSVVGTNVASDALSNVASGGVKGGAMIIVGEDYGEGSSIMQERTHAFAMKSQMWLLDPRPNLSKIVELVEAGFQLSEASHTPVMLELRVRACHMHGHFEAKDNIAPAFTVADAVQTPVRDTDRIVLPPANFLHEVEKIERRWPAGIAFVRDHRLNEWFGADDGEVGVIVQGGLFNTLNRALELEGLSDAFGDAKLPIYVLNCTYPLIPDEVRAFCLGKRAVLIVEEGQPEFIEHELNTLIRRADLQTHVVGKDVLPRAGEYTAQAIRAGLVKFLNAHAPELSPGAPQPLISPDAGLKALAAEVPPRPAGFCTGCPERPIFTAMKMVQKELGQHHVSADIGCHLFSILPPFNIGNTTMGYGLGGAGASALKTQGGKRSIAVMGDGGFWHNGLTSGVGNSVFNKDDNILLIVDNGYSAATGGQDIPSSRADNAIRLTKNPIERAVRGVGVTWVKSVTRTYDVAKMRTVFRDALTTKSDGPKVILAQSECMLNKQRREKPLFTKAVTSGERRVRERFGVDPDTCTGDHSCIRLSGCPSLTIKPNPDPLRTHPIAHVENSCVGCGLCGEVAHAAVLCPSFYRAEIIHNPTRLDRALQKLRDVVIGFLQARSAQALAARAF
jgi:indolepyruvate ferredoxin oxidoreductase alpha subunit